jgi:hypothetical protein
MNPFQIDTGAKAPPTTPCKLVLLAFSPLGLFGSPGEQLPGQFLRARTLLEMGHRLGDGALVDEARQVFEQTGARVDLAFALHVRAEMTLTSGADMDAALQRFDQAIAALDEVKAECELGVACRQRARLHAQLGQVGPGSRRSGHAAKLLRGGRGRPGPGRRGA